VFHYLEVVLPVHGNGVHQPKNTCLKSGANWQEWNQVERLGQYGFHPDLLARFRNLKVVFVPLREQCYKVRKQVSMGLVKVTSSTGNKRKGRMIWDAIDMIMPLRGLLALSCLDLSWETYML
jgi:hypothetical protein